MERVIVYVDDAAHAAEEVARLRAAGLRPDHWVLAACAPRMTSRVSKWVSHSARENWRAKWFARTQEALTPLLAQGGAQVTAVLAGGQLLALTQQLLLEHGAARVIDLRRPRVGAGAEPVQSTQAAQPGAAPVAKPRAGWGARGLLGLGTLLVLANSFAE